MTLLDYAPRPPWYRRVFTRRRVVWIFLIVIVGTTLACITPWAVERGKSFYWERRAKRHLFPAGTVVLEKPSGAGVRSTPLELLNTMPIRFTSWDYSYSIFLHRLESSAGERLVFVWAHADPGSPCIMFSTVFEPGTVLEGTRVGGANIEVWSQLEGIGRGSTLRIYAGEPDAADPSSFVVPFDLDGTRHVFRFRLDAKGERIELVSVTPAI